MGSTMSRRGVSVWSKLGLLAAIAGVSLDEMMVMTASQYQAAVARRYAPAPMLS